ncbi:MAG TPA: HD domain-containing protein [Candidatus Saccharimonadia bacterium]|jgi:5'-deoxynucleotidase YfbR-like HD superfamily hydrolase
MSNPTHGQITALITEVLLPFHQIQRDNELPTTPLRPENDVEHSWSVAVLACSLAPQIDPVLNIGKIAQFAIVHDLVELFSGDTSIFAPPEQLATKAAREHAALQRIRRDYAAFPWLADTITEYEAKLTPEAKFVSAVDKYIALQYDYLDQAAYLRRRGVTKSQYHQCIAKPKQKGHLNPAIGEYYDQVLALLDAHPEYFYQA